jgi:hydroxyethylthiazole kinase-like sugar kinase family protein
MANTGQMSQEEFEALKAKMREQKNSTVPVVLTEMEVHATLSNFQDDGAKKYPDTTVSDLWWGRDSTDRK